MKKSVRRLTVYERVTLLNVITHARHFFEDARNNHSDFLSDWDIDAEIEKLINIETLLLKMYVEE